MKGVFMHNGLVLYVSEAPLVGEYLGLRRYVQLFFYLQLWICPCAWVQLLFGFMLHPGGYALLVARLAQGRHRPDLAHASFGVQLCGAANSLGLASCNQAIRGGWRGALISAGGRK